MDAVYDKYYDQIYNWSIKKTNNKEDAEDLTNSIFLAIFEYFNKNINVDKLENLIWKNASDGKILETDVTIAKNYLSQEEITELNNLVSMYLDYAERQVKLGKIISMQEWKEKLEVFLKINEYNILKDNGKIKRKITDKLTLDEYKNIELYKTKIIFQTLMS